MHVLTVTYPFGPYSVGETISNRSEMNAAEKENPAYVVRVKLVGEAAEAVKAQQEAGREADKAERVTARTAEKADRTAAHAADKADRAAAKQARPKKDDEADKVESDPAPVETSPPAFEPGTL